MAKCDKLDDAYELCACEAWALGHRTSKAAMDFLIGLNPALATDVYFLSAFPLIFERVAFGKEPSPLAERRMMRATVTLLVAASLKLGHRDVTLACQWMREEMGAEFFANLNHEFTAEFTALLAERTQQQQTTNEKDGDDHACDK